MTEENLGLWSLGATGTTTYLTPQQRPCPDWTVTARGLRGKPIGPGREVRAEPKFELPKLQAGLPMLRTGLRRAGTSDPVDKSGLAGLQS